MKSLLLALLVGSLPVMAGAQTASSTGAKPAAKNAAAKPAAAKPAPGRNPKLARSAQKAVEEATPLEEPDPTIKLSEADIEVARKVYVGEIPCELGAKVKITPLRREGFFLVVTGINRFRMHPVESRTGAIRLEDPVRGAMWLQLGNKSMLMSQKLGQRLADECQSPDQVTYAEAMKTRPPVNLLEPPMPMRQAMPAGMPASMPGGMQGGMPCCAPPAAAASGPQLASPSATQSPQAPAAPQAASPAGPASAPGATHTH